MPGKDYKRTFCTGVAAYENRTLQNESRRNLDLGNCRLEDWVRIGGWGILEDWEMVDEAVRQNVGF